MKNHRLLGLVLLALAAALGYVALVMPYAEAQAGKDSVFLLTKAIVVVPLVALVGLGMLAGGIRFARAAFTPDNKLTLLGYAVTGAGIALGFGLYAWFEGTLSALGYGS